MTEKEILDFVESQAAALNDDLEAQRKPWANPGVPESLFWENGKLLEKPLPAPTGGPAAG